MPRCLSGGYEIEAFFVSPDERFLKVVLPDGCRQLPAPLAYPGELVRLAHWPPAIATRGQWGSEKEGEIIALSYPGSYRYQVRCPQTGGLAWLDPTEIVEVLK